MPPVLVDIYKLPTPVPPLRQEAAGARIKLFPSSGVPGAIGRLYRLVFRHCRRGVDLALNSTNRFLHLPSATVQSAFGLQILVAREASECHLEPAPGFSSFPAICRLPLCCRGLKRCVNFDSA